MVGEVSVSAEINAVLAIKDRCFRIEKQAQFRSKEEFDLLQQIPQIRLVGRKDNEVVHIAYIMPNVQGFFQILVHPIKI